MATRRKKTTPDPDTLAPVVAGAVGTQEPVEAPQAPQDDHKAARPPPGVVFWQASAGNATVRAAWAADGTLAFELASVRDASNPSDGFAWADLNEVASVVLEARAWALEEFGDEDLRPPVASKRRKG